MWEERENGKGGAPLAVVEDDAEGLESRDRADDVDEEGRQSRGAHLCAQRLRQRRS